MRWLDANSFGAWFLALVLLVGGAVTVGSQQLPGIPSPTRPNPPASPGQAPNPSDDNDQDMMTRRAMIQQAKRRNSIRQQEIVNDTNKLVKLTQQLKTDMEKGNKDEVSARRVEEIEKLAKSVKEKMKGS